MRESVRAGSFQPSRYSLCAHEEGVSAPDASVSLLWMATVETIS